MSVSQRLVVEIPAELNERVREKIGKRWGFQRGNLKRAVIEALTMWVDHDG